jgi:PAS domain S-box-containing protein
MIMSPSSPDNQRKFTGRQAALRITLLYALVSVLWITFSTYLVNILVSDTHARQILEEIKGFLFVVLTATGLYYLMRQSFFRLKDQEATFARQSEAHAAERERYQTLIKAVEDSMILLGTDGEYLAITDSAARVMNKKPEQIIGKKISDMLPEDRSQYIMGLMARVVTERTNIRTQSEYIGQNNRYWFDTIYNPVYADDGSVRAILTVSRDVTDRIGAERALMLRNEQYQTLLNTIALIAQTLRRDEVLKGMLERLAIIPTDHIEIYLQDNIGLRCAATTKESLQSYVGDYVPMKESAILLHMAESNHAATGTRATVANSTGSSIPYTPGDVVPESWMVVPLTTHDVMIGCLVFSRSDGQAFNADEAELGTAFARFAAIAISNADLFESLEQSEQNYRQLINSVDDMIYQNDAAGNQIYVNAKGRELEELEQGEPAFRKWRDIVHPDDLKLSQRIFYESLKDDVILIENRIVGKKGRVTTVSHRIRVMRDGAGNLIGHFGIGRDVTSYKQTQEHLALRVRQQEVITNLGQQALRSTSIDTLMREMVQNVNQTLGTEFCKILDFLPDGERLIIRAGEGWKDGIVGNAIVEIGNKSQAGYTLFTNEPVIVTRLNTETRFDAGLLLEHGIVSGISVIIPGSDHPLGVISAHSAKFITFTREDINFLQAAANLLGAAMERLRTEQALRDSAERNRAIVNTAGDSIITTDENGLIEAFNPAAERLFGYKSDEIRGKPIAQIIDPAQTQEQTGVTGHRKDGSTFVLELTRSEMQVGGRRMFTNIVRDITEHVESTKAVERHVRQLSILNRVLQIASAPIGFENMMMTLLTEISDVFQADAADIYLMDPNVKLLYLLAHRGYTISDEEKYQHLDVVSSLRGAAVEQGHVVTFNTPIDRDMPDQQDQVNAIAITPIWTSGSIRGTLAVALWNDRKFTGEELALLEGLGRGVGITIENARLYAEAQSYAETLQFRIEERTQELQKALIHAQSADRTKSALLSTVSHEMRTPLSSIIGFSNLIISRKPEITKTLEFAGAINSEARRLAELINDFLDLQRIESGREVFHYAGVDVNDLIVDVVRKQQISEDDSHAIEMALEPTPIIYADGNRLRQVILNLLSNAIKYSPNGGRIRMTLKQQKDMITFSISDEGLGISPDDMKRIFDHFYRSEVAERYRIRGTGLGLGLCREIIQIHNGHIWAESAGFNQGSTFSFSLPVLTPGKGMNNNDSGSDQRTKRDETPAILVIEDDPTFATYLSERLRDEHYMTYSLSFDSVTMDHVLEINPTLIILDMSQGSDQPGWGILEMLQKDGRTHFVPVIVCSVLNVPDEAKDAGAAAYIAKPVDEEKLIKEVLRLTTTQKSV